jgi:hypothetical protein
LGIFVTNIYVSGKPKIKEIPPLLFKNLKTIQILARSSYIDCNILKPILGKQNFPSIDSWREISKDSLISLFETTIMVRYHILFSYVVGTMYCSDWTLAVFQGRSYKT